MRKRQRAPTVGETTHSAKTEYDDHLRACEQCFQATARGDLCAVGLRLHDAIPEVPTQTSTPRGIGSYGPEGLDEAMTFPANGPSAGDDDDARPRVEPEQVTRRRSA